MSLSATMLVPSPSPGDVAPGIGATAFSLLLVLVLIFGLGALLKRVQGGRMGRAGELRIRAGLQVGAKERVLLIDAAGTHLLIGVSVAGIRTLHRFESLPPPPDAAGGTGLNPSLASAFLEVLKRSTGQGDKP